LTLLTYNFPFPAGGWCPYLAAADPAMHLAVPMYPSQGYGEQNGPYQLATYTIESDGNLTTTSTSATMPKVAVDNLTALSMSPSGKLLAVAGTSGLQIFHFNGAEPVKAYTGLLTSSEVYEVSWDNDNHLYAISNSADKLWVFDVTPTSHSLVARYSVNQPIGLTVLSLPLP
jgi:WD40 repeat protein